MKPILIFPAALIGLVLCVQPPSWSATDDLSERLASADYRVVLQSRVRSPDAVKTFYGARRHLPAWTRASRRQLHDLRAGIDDAAAHGLTPDDYHASALARAEADNDDVAMEILATDAYLTLGAHLLRGKLNPVSIEPDWTALRRSGDLVRRLSDALAKARVRASLNELAPDVAAYRALQAALVRIADRADDKDPRVPPGPMLKIGARGPRVALLRERLASMGLMDPAPDGPSDVFDLATETAVAALQREVGLEADGIAGPLTLHEMNRSAADRIAQIRANLERWRWLAEDLGRRHIRVNIPEFRLESWENGRRIAARDVIVGRAYRMTPVFSGEISYAVVNPSWDTPRSIARRDKLPDFQADPDQVRRLGFDVFGPDGSKLDPAAIDWKAYSATNFPLRLRQRPGPLNALGRVKLMFPNRHNVYLHDTPARELFDRTQRSFSSGCIRVDDMMGLTEWVLSETPGWNLDKIGATAATGRETRVNLARAVPVHILYMTVVAAADGSIRFLSDVYGRDPRLIAALDQSPPR